MVAKYPYYALIKDLYSGIDSTREPSIPCDIFIDESDNIVIKIVIIDGKREFISVKKLEGYKVNIKYENPEPDPVKAKKVYLHKIARKNFEESIGIADSHNIDRLTAVYRDSVLTITIPPYEEVQPTEFDIE